VRQVERKKVKEGGRARSRPWEKEIPQVKARASERGVEQDWDREVLEGGTATGGGDPLRNNEKGAETGSGTFSEEKNQAQLQR